jgi:hypothetical protein
MRKVTASQNNGQPTATASSALTLTLQPRPASSHGARRARSGLGPPRLPSSDSELGAVQVACTPPATLCTRRVPGPGLLWVQTRALGGDQGISGAVWTRG